MRTTRRIVSTSFRFILSHEIHFQQLVVFRKTKLKGKVAIGTFGYFGCEVRCEFQQG